MAQRIPTRQVMAIGPLTLVDAVSKLHVLLDQLLSSLHRLEPVV